MVVRILVTGMSGTGKSTLLTSLADRGRVTLDTDDPGWTEPDGAWNVARLAAYLAAHPEIIVSGTVENQGELADHFDHIVLLSAPLPVILDRVSRRATNPYGSSEADRAEIAEYLTTVEPLLRRMATLELDATHAPDLIVAKIEELLDGDSESGNRATRE